MKRGLIFLAALLMSLSASLAAERSEALSSMIGQVNALGGYSVDFSLEMQSQRFEGSYAVSGESYYITLGGTQEFYGDSSTRYEISHTLSQVVIDLPPREKRTLLDDPANAFNMLAGEQFVAKERKGSVVLTPIEGALMRITISAGRDGLPAQLVYSSAGDEVVIKLGKFRRLEQGIKSFDAAEYVDFETIDLR